MSENIAPEASNEPRVKPPNLEGHAGNAVVQVARKNSILKQITDLYELPIKDLKERYHDLISDGNATAKKDFLIRRIARKLQEDVFGKMSTPTLDHLNQLKTDINPLEDLGRRSAKSSHSKSSHRLPLPGTVISKTYKGKLIQVKVLEKGFEYNGKPYRSLSRIAREVSGVHQSGFVFFAI